MPLKYAEISKKIHLFLYSRPDELGHSETQNHLVFGSLWLLWTRLNETYRRFDCEGGNLVLRNIDILGVGIGIIRINVVLVSIIRVHTNPSLYMSAQFLPTYIRIICVHCFCWSAPVVMVLCHSQQEELGFTSG